MEEEAMINQEAQDKVEIQCVDEVECERCGVL
jgi:hypothetical protein